MFIAPKDTTITFNRFMHRTFDVIGSNLTGREELTEFELSKFPVGDHARQILLSEGEGSYDNVHRLARGKLYGIVLLPGTCIPQNKKRTSNNLREKAVKTFGYYSSLAGAAPSLCEPAFCQYMESIGVRDIVPLHEPILAAHSESYLLKIMCFKKMLSSSNGYPEFLWDCETMFAFFCNPEG